MEKLGFGLDDDSGTGDQKQTNPRESRLLSIQLCIKYLVHVNQCREAHCRLPTCQKLKRVVKHAKSCKKKTNGGCPICKQFIALCCYHVMHCQEAKCPVLLCVNIKNKLRQQQLQQRLQQAQILKRQNATMQNCGMSGAVLQASPGNSNSSSQPSPGAQPHSSPHPPQPGIGMKPSSGPPVGALQAAAARQSVPNIFSANYGKDNPLVSPSAANSGLIAPNQPMQSQMQKPISQIMSGVPNPMLNMGNVASWENSGYAQGPQPHQNTQPLPNPQLGIRQPSQIMGEPSPMPNSIGNSTMGPPQDFDLCVNCFNKEGHNHKMEKLVFGLDDDSGTGDQKQTNPRESRLLSIQQCIKYLVHVCQCRDAHCRLPSCQKLKRVVQHAKSCKKKTNGGCPICKQFTALCCYHAKQCQEAKCPVLFCVNIKKKLRQQQLQQRLQQAQILKRQIATMQNRGMSGAVLQASPGNSNSSSQPSPGAQPHSSPHPSQPGIGMASPRMASPTQPPVSPQQGILGYPQGPIPSPQHLMQQVHSPPPTAAQLSQAVCSPQLIAWRTQSNTP